jgi:hypothetical protein
MGFYMDIHQVPEATLPCPNLRASIEKTGLELMKAFAHAPQNVYRGEIIRFREALRDITTFAKEYGKYIPIANSLAYYARYCESKWFEKEYGDSQFEPFETHVAIQQKIGGDFEEGMTELTNWISRPEIQTFINRAREANGPA